MSYRNPLAFRASQDHVQLALSQLADRVRCGEVVCLAEGFELAHVPGRYRSCARPSLYRALCYAEGLVGYDEVGVNFELVAQSRAGGAGAVGIVEAEGTGFQFAEADVAVDAGEVLGEQHLLLARNVN